MLVDNQLIPCFRVPPSDGVVHGPFGHHRWIIIWIHTTLATDDFPPRDQVNYLLLSCRLTSIVGVFAFLSFYKSAPDLSKTRLWTRDVLIAPTYYTVIAHVNPRDHWLFYYVDFHEWRTSRTVLRIHDNNRKYKNSFMDVDIMVLQCREVSK